MSDISDDKFLKFKEFFYRRTGFSSEPTKRYFVDKRLIERIQSTGTKNFRGYFTLLRFQASGEELQLLLTKLSIRERTLVLLDEATCLRVSELLALRWRDVDFNTLEFNVTRSI